VWKEFQIFQSETAGAAESRRNIDQTKDRTGLHCPPVVNQRNEQMSNTSHVDRARNWWLLMTKAVQQLNKEEQTNQTGRHSRVECAWGWSSVKLIMLQLDINWQNVALHLHHKATYGAADQMKAWEITWDTFIWWNCHKCLQWDKYAQIPANRPLLTLNRTWLFWTTVHQVWLQTASRPISVAHEKQRLCWMWRVEQGWWPNRYEPITREQLSQRE